MHGIIWTNKGSEYINKVWRYGFTWLSNDKNVNGYVNERTINYIIKYVTKIDEKHKEYKNIILTSAGIGKGYINRFDAIVKNISPVKKSDYVPNIEFNIIPFDSKGAAYWNSYNLPIDFLEANNVFQVGLWAIDKKIQKKTEDEVVFAYVPKDLQNKVKILRIGPNVPKEDKWRTNLQNTYLWSYWKYKDNPVKDLFIAKSYKDELVLKFLGYDVISLQSENAKVLLENNVEKIDILAKNKYMVMGSDPQGRQTRIEICRKTNWDYFETDKYLYDRYQMEDPADLVKEFGLECLNNLLKLKLNIN